MKKPEFARRICANIRGYMPETIFPVQKAKHHFYHKNYKDCLRLLVPNCNSKLSKLYEHLVYYLIENKEFEFVLGLHKDADNIMKDKLKSIINPQYFNTILNNYSYDEVKRISDFIYNNFLKFDFSLFLIQLLYYKYKNINIISKIIDHPENFIGTDIINFFYWFTKINNDNNDYIKIISNKPYISKLNKLDVIYILNYYLRFSDSNKLYCHKLYNELINQFLRTKTKDTHKVYLKNKFDRKLAFVTAYSGSLNYFWPIIKQIGPLNIDIFINENVKNYYSTLSELNNFNVFYDGNELDKYEYVMGDIHDLPNFISSDTRCEHKLIKCLHGSDAYFSKPSLESSSLLFVQFENAIVNQKGLIFTKFLNSDNKTTINSVRQEDKCELFYSGPFQLEKFFVEKKSNLINYKQKISELYDIDINKPLILFLEDELTPKDSIYNALNYLSESFTIIYKEILRDDEIKRKIKSSIIVYDSPFFAPNDIKLASDYVFSNFFSGTLLSSIMADIIAVPYYTSLIKNKWSNDPLQSYRTRLNHDISLYSTPNEYIKATFPIFFNLDEIETSVNLLKSGDYKIIYENYIKKFRAQIFGNYYAMDVAQVTANRILKYVNNGSLGDEADAVYIKDSYWI